MIVLKIVNVNPQATENENQSAYKAPQATYNGDVMGGSVVRGNAWGFLYLGC